MSHTYAHTYTYTYTYAYAYAYAHAYAHATTSRVHMHGATRHSYLRAADGLEQLRLDG
jgi:hypothetical protein